MSSLEPWDVVETGTSKVIASGEEITLQNDPTQHYTNAQISDYGFSSSQATQPLNFQHHASTHLQLTARAEVDHQPADAHMLIGTAGFGFWNHPFSPDAKRFPQLPRALWFFFASQPSAMALALDVDGHGWKAAQLDTTSWQALRWVPLAIPTVLAFQSTRLFRRLYPRIQRDLKIAEVILPANLLREDHLYEIVWNEGLAQFKVDHQVVLQTPFAPQGKMGFTAWIDNQYAVVSPRGRFGGGVIPLTHSQSLIVKGISLHHDTASL